MPAIIPQTETILKSYFETGDKPTQLQFEELIGTMFHLYQLAQTTADDAAADAAAALARQPQALLKASLSGSTFTIEPGALNITSITKPSSDTIRVTWTTPFADADYKIAITPHDQTEANAGLVVNIVAQTTTRLEFNIRNVNMLSGSTYHPFHLIAFN